MRSNDQQGPAWDLLVPQQQALIPRTAFLACGAPTAAVNVESVEVKDSYIEDTQIPGTEEIASSTAVTLEVEFEIAGQPSTDTVTIHLFDVDGQWRWMLNGDAVTNCVT